MGNTLSASNALFATYVPVNVTSLREEAEAQMTNPPKGAACRQRHVMTIDFCEIVRAKFFCECRNFCRQKCFVGTLRRSKYQGKSNCAAVPPCDRSSA